MMITVIKKSLILTAFICLVTLGSVFSNANIGTENWSYKIGDSPIDSNGNFEWLKEDSNGWQEFNYPKRPPVDGQERLWLKTYIKGNDISNLTLFFATQDQGVEVYIDGKLASKRGPVTDTDKYIGVYWHLVDLPSDMTNKPVYFRVYSNWADNLGLIERLSVDTSRNHFFKILQRDFMYILSFPVALFITIIMIYALVISKPKEKIYFYAMAFFGLLTIWIVSASDLKLFINENAGMWWYFLLFCVYSMPMFFNALAKEVVNKEYKNSIKKIIYVNIFTWAIFVFGELIHSGMMQTGLSVFYVTLFFLELIVIYLMVKSVFKGNEESKTFLIGFVIMPILVVYDVLGSHFRVLPWITHVTSLGSFAFALALIRLFSLRILERQRLVTLAKVLEDEVAKAHEKALIDPLTQVFNRNKFTLALEAEIAKNAENYQPLTLIMLDIDWFKKVNDTYGHDVGDEVLIEFANIIKNTIGYNQLLARYGGEEFIILCCNQDIDQTIELGEKIRQVVENHLFTAKQLRTTASLGISKWRENDVSGRFIKRADLALYLAKASGRNKVVSENEV